MGKWSCKTSFQENLQNIQQEKQKFVVFEPRPLPSFPFPTQQETLHSRLQQARNGAPLFSQLPTKGLSSQERHDLSVFHPAPRHLLRLNHMQMQSRAGVFLLRTIYSWNRSSTSSLHAENTVTLIALPPAFEVVDLHHRGSLPPPPQCSAPTAKASLREKLSIMPSPTPDY